jgi:phosphotransferase system HPr-like phosphotransfer protein
MRQTIAFQATAFEAQAVEVEADPDEEADPESMPVAVLVFQSGQNVVLTVPVSAQDAENMMNAFTEAEPHRGQIPDVQWNPQPAGLPEGLFWMLSPAVVGISVTPPQATPDGVIPHWTLAFDDPEGSQVQVAVSEGMSVQVIRSLSDAANGELATEDEG